MTALRLVRVLCQNAGTVANVNLLIYLLFYYAFFDFTKATCWRQQIGPTWDRRCLQ